jgi:hypothetical protein
MSPEAGAGALPAAAAHMAAQQRLTAPSRVQKSARWARGLRAGCITVHTAEARRAGEPHGEPAAEAQARGQRSPAPTATSPQCATPRMRSRTTLVDTQLLNTSGTEPTLPATLQQLHLSVSTERRRPPALARCSSATLLASPGLAGTCAAAPPPARCVVGSTLGGGQKNNGVMLEWRGAYHTGALPRLCPAAEGGHNTGGVLGGREGRPHGMQGGQSHTEGTAQAQPHRASAQ